MKAKFTIARNKKGDKSEYGIEKKIILSSQQLARTYVHSPHTKHIHTERHTHMYISTFQKKRLGQPEIRKTFTTREISTRIEQVLRDDVEETALKAPLAWIIISLFTTQAPNGRQDRRAPSTRRGKQIAAKLAKTWENGSETAKLSPPETPPNKHTTQQRASFQLKCAQRFNFWWFSMIKITSQRF